MSQASKYPGEQTVAIRVPTRLLYCLENQIIPYLLAQGSRSAQNDILVVNLDRVKHYQLRKRGVVHRAHLYDHGAIVSCPTREEFYEKLRQIRQAYTSKPKPTGGQKAEELIG